MAFAYILESATTKRWYYGSTNNHVTRVVYHNKGWNRSTKGRGPWTLIFLKEFPMMDQAREFEFKLKRLKSKSYVQKKYGEHFLDKNTRPAPT